MAKLTDEAKKLIAEIHPAQVATSNKKGMPNVAPKGSFRVLDDEHVIFTDMGRVNTLKNLRENPFVSALVLDAATRKGCRIWGKCEIFESGELFDTVKAQQIAAGRPAPQHLVKVTVQEVLTF